MSPNDLWSRRRLVRRMLLNGIEALEERHMLASDWRNVLQPLNVSGDDLQTVTPLDVLIVINEINSPTIRASTSSPLPVIGANGKSPPPYVDVDCDNFVTPLDVLIIINAINSKDFGPSWRFSQNGGGADAGNVSPAACFPKLQEGSSFVTSLISDIEIPSDANLLSFEYASLSFDTSSHGRAHDAFEAALLDSSGRSLVPTLGTGRDAFFNVTEDLPVTNTNDVTMNGNKVSLSLANVLPGTKAQLVLRLVNNDGDKMTSVVVPSVRFEQGATLRSSTVPSSGPMSTGGAAITGGSLFGGANGQPSSTFDTNVFPRPNAVVGRPIAEGNSNVLNSNTASKPLEVPVSPAPPVPQVPLNSRGKEFWVGFPDNLFEGNNRPQKALYITGDIATKGVVDIPGLIDPATSLPFHKDIIVNPGVVSVVELPSLDVGDNNDNDTDFDVEVELIARVQRKGIHVVTQDPVAVYGLDLAVSTSDAFLALPVNSLGSEYINLGYENTYASIAHVEGTQFLVVATQDNTQVTLAPGQYSGATTSSNAAIFRPNGTTEFNLGNSDGRDIGPFVTDAAGNGSLVVHPPFDGYSGTYKFELVDVATAAILGTFDAKTTINFPTGRESKVVAFDVIAGQRLYYDAINPSPAPNVSIRILSASGDQGDLFSQTDNNSFVYLFGALQFRETGKYYFVITGEQPTAFDFSFRLVNMDAAPRITLGADYTAVVSPAGRAEIYRLDGNAGQVLCFDAFNPDRNVGFTVYGPGGQQVIVNTASDDRVFVLPETSTYYILLDSASFVPSSFGFRLLDLQSAPALPFGSPLPISVADGHLNGYRFSALAAQTFSFDIQSIAPFFRATVYLIDPTGNVVNVIENGNQRSVKLMTSGSYTLLIGALTVQEGGTITILPSLVNDPLVTKSGFNTNQTMTISAGGSAKYSFNAPAGTRVLLDGLNVVTADLNLEFNAPDGTRLFTGFGLANDTQDVPRFGPTFLPQSGTYTLTVRGNSPSASGSYDFRVLDLDTFGTPLALQTQINGNFPTGREAQVYTFDANVGDQLLFDGRSGAFIFGIYDQNLNAIYSRGIFGAASTAEVDGIGRVLQSGRHYILFQGDLYIPRDYSFQIQNLKLSPSLAIGAEASGSVAVNGEVVYRMQLTSGQRIRLDSLLPYSSDINYRIANSGGRALYDSGYQNFDSSPPGNQLIVVPESGEYFVFIQSRQSTTGSYRFRFDDLALAPALTFDADLEVTLSPGNAARVFRIDAQAGETIQLDNLGTLLPLDWGITGPTTQYRGGFSDGQDFSAKILSSGTHYFTISGRQDSGPITIRFLATRTPGPVVSLTGFNTVVNLNVGINETKTYSFSAPTGRLVYLNVMRSDFAIRTQTVTLNQGETYLLRDSAERGPSGAADLTGSFISSTKPVAVFGGNRATFIPSQYFAADHLVEQLPPTNTWGREFVTMPLVTGSTRGDLFRFLAQANNTQVKVNGSVVATLKRGQFFEQSIVGPGHIESSGPILVAQYAYSQQYYRTDPGGNPSFQGDPLMMIVPPFEQFLANYTVSTPVVSSILSAQRFDRNFINIVAPAEAVGLIEVNGVAVAANKFVAIGTSGFFGTQVPIELGAFQLAGPLPFGAFVYGFGSFDSYGYVGGQALSPVATVSSVVLNPATANPQIGNSFSLTSRVADVSGSPVQGIRVDFDVAGVNPQRSFGFSDANGLVQFTYVGVKDGRDIVTASVGQLLDDSIIDWRTGAAAPQIIVAAPLNGSSVAVGTTLVATGLAIADFPLATLDLVTVNGVPVTSVDAAGNFFIELFVGPGENEFEFAAIDSNGNTGSQVIRISGTQLDTSKVDFSQFANVTGSFQETYARTSFNQSNRSLLAETAIVNIGQFPTDVPLLVAISNISDPMVLVRGADGQRPDGIPYYDFTGLTTGGTLTPRSKTGFLSAEFYNPNQTQFTYDLVFYGKLNEPPQINSLPTTEADLNREYRYDVVAVDPNHDAITFELVEAPAGMAINSTNGQIRWTPTNSDTGLHTVDIRVSDSRLGVSAQRFTLSARPTPANRTPVFNSLPVAVADVGVAYPYTAQAIDSDGDVLGYRLVTAPTGMKINPLSGAIQWIPTTQQLGAQPVVIEVSDSRGGSAEQSFSLLVLSPADNAAPVIVSTAPTAIKLSGLTFQVVALDADSQPLTYRLSNAPAGMTISPAGLISWTPTTGQFGPHQVAIEVLDTRGGRASQSFTLAVFDNQDPVITSSPITTAQLNVAYSYQMKVTDSIDDLLSFKLIDAPVGMTINASSGLISWSVTKAAYELEPVTIAVFDGRGGMAVQQFTIAVAGGQGQAFNITPVFVSTPPSVASVGTTLNYKVQARDPDGDSLTFDLPLSPHGMVIDATTGQLGWLPQSNQSGVQQVVIRVKDGQGGIWLQSFQINVDGYNTAPVITSSPLLNASVGVQWEYRLHVQDADGDPLMFELVSPASGMTLTASSNSDANAVLRFSPTVAGTVDVVLVAKDSRGGRTEQRFAVQVAATAANIAPIIHSQPRLTIPAGQTWVYLVAADDPNGDPITFSLPTAPTGMTFDAGQRLVSWTPTLSQLGSHAVVVNVTDGRGGSVSQSVTLHVVSNSDNNAPSIVSPPSAFRATVGEPFQYNLKASDDDADPVEWTLVEAPHGASLDRRYGTLRWTPTLDQLGLQRFIVSAKDPLGLEALQSFSLNVSGANLGPSILSRAPSEAVVGDRYVYGVRAVDPENDPLNYAIKSGPTGMTIDSARGIIRWTPTLGQLGTASATVEVTDSRGNKSTQRFPINVSQVVRNQEPIITSRAIFRARVDALYQYDVNAIDPEGNAISYSLVTAPTGMQIDSTNGLISWTPTTAQAGSHLVQVAAQDSAGGRSIQRFAVLARINQAPVIVSHALTSVALGEAYHYDLQVTDVEGDALGYELVTGPVGMTIDSFGRVNWQTEPGVPVSSPVGLRVTDSYGAAATQVYVLAVTPDTTAPRVELRLSANPVALGHNAVVVVQVSDNVGVVKVSLTMNGQPQVLDANHSVTLRGDIAGLYALRATARDASGNEGISTISLRVFDPADTQGPTIRLTSPQPNAVVTKLTDIVGSITDDNLQFYRIDYGRADLVDINKPEESDPDYRTLVTGNNTAVDKILGTFDPTMLLNDDYVIRVVAQDLSGNVSSKVVPLSLDGQLKLGEFKLDFTDLSIPVAGIPITITRSYDTRNAGESGDFGFGWALGVQDAQIRESIPVNPLEEGGLFFAATPFREGTKVYLTNPEGRRVGFTFKPQRQFSLFGGGSYAPTFVPDPGVYDTLDVGSVPLRKIGDAFYSGFFGDPFNPSAYRLTTKAGIVYEYGQFSGLANVIDRNDNRLEFRPDGIFSSSGPSIRFVRDPQGRIEKIIDPAGNPLTYEYDIHGDLAAWANQAGLTTTFSYISEPAHLLSRIVDPLGNQLLGPSYDSEGRINGVQDAVGNKVTNNVSVKNRTEILTNASGKTTKLIYDERGNVIERTNRLGGVQRSSFDEGGNILSSTDPRGFTTSFDYDSRGNITRVLDPMGHEFRFAFNEHNQILAADNASYRYDAFGNLDRFVNALGDSSSLKHDSQGRVTTLVDALGIVTSYTYGRGEYPTALLFSDGKSRHFEYNVFGQITQDIDENGNATKTTYDAAGRQLTLKDAIGGVTTYAYDGQNLSKVTKALGNATSYAYDSLGNMILRTDALGAKTQSRYDKDGNILEATDAHGNKTAYEYNSNDDLTLIVDPLGRRQIFDYDSSGNVVASTDANGSKTLLEYDGIGRIFKQTDALGGVSQSTYDAFGNVLSATDEKGRITQFAYDAVKRLTSVLDPLGNRIEYRYDSVGNLVEIVDSKGEITKYQYDNRRRRILTKDAEGGEFKYFYDGKGNLVAETDPLQRTTTHVFDANNRRIASIDPLGGRTETSYDAAGSIKSVTDPLGNSTVYSYDALSRLVSKVDPRGNTSRLEYDEVGNLKASTDREGRIRRFSYDAIDRLTSEVWVGATTPAETFEYSYDADGNRQSARDTRSKYQFTYDSLNRNTSIDNSGSIGVPHVQLNYSYDAVGNQLSVSDNYGVRVDKTYDNRDLVSSLVWQGGGVESARFNYSYDEKEQVLEVDRFSDITGTTRIGRSQYEYDRTGRTKRLTHTDAVDAVLSQYTYEYDLAGQLNTSTNHGQTAAYSYDANGQLKTAVHSNQPNESYTYDKNGNRVATGTVITTGNQLASDSDFDYSYDREGNLVSKLNRASGERVTYSYDFRNRLTFVKMFSAAGQPTEQIQYLYDPFDDRIGSVVNGEATYSIYDNGHVWKDFNSSGIVVASYLFGQEVDEILARYQPSDGMVSQLADRLGSVKDHIDSTGKAINHIDYDSFGKIVAETNPSIADRFKFTGREYNTTTGLYNFRARTYDPRTGRFMSQDPLGFVGGDTNFYRYVNNSPLNATDPSGLSAIGEFGGVQFVCLSYVYPLFKTGMGRAAIKKDIQAEILSFTFTGGDVGAQNVANYSIAALVLELVDKYVAAGEVEGPIVIDDYQTAPGSLVFRMASTEKACHEEIDISTAFFVPGPRICFAGETQILTQRGFVRFDELKKHDSVLSSPENETAGTLEFKSVEEIFVNHGPIWHIRVNGQMIRTTASHPFHVQDKGWTPCQALLPGDMLRSHDGQYMPVESVNSTGTQEVVYNCRIADFHTYFVGSEDWGFTVWAHNSACDDAAEALGYRRTNFRSHGQPVYFNGKNYISPDVDAHNVTNGWKMAKTVDGLRSKRTRMGTCDANLNRIGD